MARMSRSRTQLATVYAPGALFTFEGGLGCCISIPELNRAREISAVIRSQIFDLIRQYVESWRARASGTSVSGGPPPASLCVDSAFLDSRNNVQIDPSRFVFCDPATIGFQPFPLIMKCENCGLLLRFSDPNNFLRHYENRIRSAPACSNSDNHAFFQLDVVFVHQDGTIEGLYPETLYYSIDNGEINIRDINSCIQCGSTWFRITTHGSSSFRDWRFVCANCNYETRIVKQSRDSLIAYLEQNQANDTHFYAADWNMVPVSYRASNVFYVSREQFLQFDDPTQFTILSSNQRNDLERFLTDTFGVPGIGRPDDEQLISDLESSNHPDAGRVGSLLRTYMDLISQMAIDNPGRQDIENQLQEYRTLACAILEVQVNLPEEIVTAVEDRNQWTRRFDPIRLAVEHDILRSQMTSAINDPNNPDAVDVLNPDHRLRPPRAEIDFTGYEAQVNRRLQRLGIMNLYFLRAIDLVEFTFAYSRVASTPLTSAKTVPNRTVPVKLKSFRGIRTERSTSIRRPIYVLTQTNEALYISLNPDMVQDWLISNQVIDWQPLETGEQIGSKYISHYLDFGLFLDRFGKNDASVNMGTAEAIYLLLHTCSHHFAHAVASYSGLDLGSIGEYLFPADLSFIIYRRSMTPDLGSLSAMWRNDYESFLDYLLSPRSLRCNSGTLCDHRGGACPGCIMLPEVTCVASNRLLSRAALIGGPQPRWRAVSEASPLRGYYEIVRNYINESNQ